MRRTITVVVTTYNDAAFLADAVASIKHQLHPADEIIVVDDGSSVDPSPVVAAFPGVALIRKVNGGLSSARNAGLRAATSSHILFLDADDRLTPEALGADLSCVATTPDAVFVYGAHRRVDAAWTPTGADKYDPVGDDAFGDLLSGNRIGMHATVLYRRDALLAAGGFDESLRRCEDYDVYLRLSRSGTVACHPATVAEYRWHGANMSRHANEMLACVLAVHARYRPIGGPALERWEQGKRNFTSYYEAEARMNDRDGRVGRAKALARRMVGALRRRTGRGWPPPLGRVRPRHLAGDRPVSLDFGWDRGTPVDRFYVERFLEACTKDIAGRVLEIGDAAYSKRFGGARISRQDVLHVRADAPGATIVGDIATPGTLPEAAFDCIVLTQTLHLIFEIDTALAELARALKPGGVLLLTVPGITQLDRGEWGASWYWSFTAIAMRRLLAAHFPAALTSVEAHGNVFTAVSYLHGLALEEIDTARLESADAAYPVIVTVRAVRAHSDA